MAAPQPSLWLVTLWYAVLLNTPAVSVWLGDSGVFVQGPGEHSRFCWVDFGLVDVERYIHYFKPLPMIDLDAAGGWFVAIPLWLVLLALAGPTVVLWRRDRPIPRGHCRSCGYNLTGNVSGVCPECGTKP